MLVLTTMYVGVSQSLPKTSGIKMIDYWLIFNLMVPFIEVILHINKDLKEKQEESQNKNDNSTVYPDVIKVNSEDGNIHEVVSISKVLFNYKR